MINLFYSESYFNYTNKMCGPKKVVYNLIESLEQENIPYSVNKDVYEYNFLLQYDAIGYEKHEKLEHESCVIGPQFWTFDNNPYGKFLIENPQYYKKLIAPSYWVKDLLVNKLNVPDNKVAIWPVGIKSLNLSKDIKYDCLIYFKRRSTEELEEVTKFLEEKELSYNIIHYGDYSEDDLQKLSSESKFCFLLNGTESQGIAVQEIMSSNTPVLVWDVSEWNDQGPDWSVSSTSVPYWSDVCGEKFYHKDDLEKTFEKFYSNIDTYNPKELIETELSYKISVEKIIKIFEEQ